jgi:hypothetical protein
MRDVWLRSRGRGEGEVMRGEGESINLVGWRLVRCHAPEV